MYLWPKNSARKAGETLDVSSNFFEITVSTGKNNTIEIAPDFQAEERNPDLMIRGKDFYAVWDEEKGLWSTEEYDVKNIVDRELMKKKDELLRAGVQQNIRVRKMKSFGSQSWNVYCSYKSKMPNRYVQLDDKLVFADQEVKKEDYVSRKLPYALKPGSHESWDEIVGTLYSEENRQKIEWAIGSVVSGDSRKIQKFMVLYGKAGTGKSTIIDIIKSLFEGYCAVFDAGALTSASKDFSMAPFKTNPLIAYQTDSKLSKIETNTRLNSIVSHETILLNEKNKPQYPFTPHAFLILGSNDPVQITDQQSGIIRRLIDVKPTGNLIPADRYELLMERVKFELGGIADHCLKVYKKLGKHYYDSYRPKSMMFETDAFYNFVWDRYDDFVEINEISLATAYTWWEDYAQRAGVDYKLVRHRFARELKNYFKEFKDFAKVDGRTIRGYFIGFRKELFIQQEEPKVKEAEVVQDTSVEEKYGYTHTESVLDELLKDCKAQYAAEDSDRPKCAWDNVNTTLKDIDTHKLHYLLGPEWLVRIDFDLKNKEGIKDKNLNLEAASKWPPTYGEISKSGGGVHCYYRYSGDPNDLRGMFAPDIEVKINKGKNAIRRKLTVCNNLEIATISSGLPKKEKKLVNNDVIRNEQYLNNVIRKVIRSVKASKDPNGNKKDIIEGCEHTKPAIDFIKHLLDDAYASGISYDVTRLRPIVMAFAMQSTNQKRYCTDLIRKMQWQSKEASEQVEGKHKGKLAFFDFEVAPNVNILCWKPAGPEHTLRKIIMPQPKDIEELFEYDAIGFNNRKYDNHIAHAIRLGYTPYQVYKVSELLIKNSEQGYFREAWDYSKGDIYDFSSEKKSLKKFEIDMDAHHQEMGVDWTKPIPEERWPELADYCGNDVLATEQLFFTKERQADWKCREILADITGMSTNSTTNSLSTRFIFQGDKNPQKQFNYRWMGTNPNEVETYLVPTDDMCYGGVDPVWTVFDAKHRPVFPGYEYKQSVIKEKLKDGTIIKRPGPWVSTYRGEEVGEGGYVYAEPGVYTNVALLDIASMHPSSIIAEQLFGELYTKRFEEIYKLRLLIKHKRYDEAKPLLGGKLAKYLDDPEQAEELSNAMKIVINSVYGLTDAGFANAFRDERNKDNIVAKRGALFMVNLKHEVQRRGYTVCHIKTDSIKIPNADNDIIRFVMEYGKLYGYTFEHEATFERFCLITKADYVAYGESLENCQKQYGYLPTKQKKYADKWTSTGKQLSIPYVFKTLFSHEDIVLRDMMETISVTTELDLDMNENLSEGDHKYIFVGKCGAFCPILPGKGGGELLRKNGDKFDSATGAKGYRWKEYEVVRDMLKEGDIDRSYYDVKCDKARFEIGKYLGQEVREDDSHEDIIRRFNLFADTTKRYPKVTTKWEEESKQTPPWEVETAA